MQHQTFQDYLDICEPWVCKDSHALGQQIKDICSNTYHRNNSLNLCGYIINFSDKIKVDSSVYHSGKKFFFTSINAFHGQYYSHELEMHFNHLTLTRFCTNLKTELVMDGCADDWDTAAAGLATCIWDTFEDIHIAEYL